MSPHKVFGSLGKINQNFMEEISKFQGIVGCTPTNVPLWEIPQKNYITWVFMGYNPQESLQ